MKTNYGLVLALILSTGAMAQPAAPATNATRTVTATTNAPTTKPAAKKTTAKKTAAPKKPVVVARPVQPVPPGPAVVGQNVVNVRARAAINSEVITRLHKGDAVTVLEEITLKKPKADEPANWVRIVFPTNAHVWVHGTFVDATNKAVLAAKLNVRSGPGENYSVVGQLLRGETVTEIGAKDRWLEIQAPTNAYAFIASHLLIAKPTIVAAVEPPAESKPPVETAQVSTPPTVAPVVEAPGTAQPATPPPSEPPLGTPVTQPEKEEEPLPPRIVEREGIVKGTVSIQSPSYFKLVSPENGETINYLYSNSTNLVLKKYKGLRIIVTGEEGLDERWTNTPVITIQKIQVVEE